jgi:subtilisin family serine protease
VKKLLIAILVLAASAVFSVASADELPAAAKGKIESILMKKMSSKDEDATFKVWVYFVDKGLDRHEKADRLRQAEENLTDKARRRRAKVMEVQLVTVADLPLHEAYVSEIENRTERLRAKSRWLNAVSAVATERQILEIAALPFVGAVDLVKEFRRREIEIPKSVQPAQPRERSEKLLDYGLSYDQLAQIQVPDMHDMNLSGQGVMVGMLDTGFNTFHQALRTRNIIATRDFIQWDTVVYNQTGDHPSQHNHGTSTMSLVGGYYAGELIGPAYNADFVLGKTEQYDDEQPIEEDWYVAGLEWADSLGSDIVTASLGYYDWYTYEDMDGNTAVTTIAVDMAVARGITCVNSMGNEGSSSWKYMIAPADADSVISIGAVDPDGDRVYFSSVGPTYDGRIKPDVMALGYYNYVASGSDTSDYFYGAGTSFSCPLVAGVCALLLEAHPDWGPMDVLDTLRATATQASSPDTLMGWGIVQGYDALMSSPVGIGDDEVALQVPANGLVLGSCYPNPFNPSTAIPFSLAADGDVRLAVYSVAGELVKVLVDKELPAGSHLARWDGSDLSGRPVSSGIYFATLMSGNGQRSTKLVLAK